MMSKPITKAAARMLSMSPANEGVPAIATGLARVGDYLALTKPRVMSLVVFTAVVGLVVAPGHLDPMVGSIAILCIALGAGAAGEGQGIRSDREHPLVRSP